MATIGGKNLSSIFLILRGLRARQVHVTIVTYPSFLCAAILREIMVDKEDLHLRHSAYHEGGHAVGALYLECLVREVHIYDERGGYIGDTKFDIPRSEGKEKAAQKACTVGLSGIAAALKHDPSRDPRANGDKERVCKILRVFPSSDRLTLYTECEAKASEFVVLLWLPICEIAKALESKPADSNGRRFLGQTEVEEIYESTYPTHRRSE